jgi:RNA polymerase sigma-70 factor (ECF subfamily)
VAGVATIKSATLERVFRQAGLERWSLPRDVFSAAVVASVDRAFADRTPSRGDVDRYIAGLHVADLALACACARGLEGAWDHFVREYRPILYRAADAIDPSGGARELADSLYADLYGLREADGERRSLFRYFHGRSSLATWLRAVLSQRHVDAIRSARRTDPLPDEDDRAIAVAPPPGDPDRSRLLQLTLEALHGAIGGLSVKDRLRLRSYYAQELTLAQVGRITGEHEATVSRHLARTRRELRDAAERRLRDEHGLADVQVTRALELAVEDPAGLDLQRVFGSSAECKDPPG